MRESQCGFRKGRGCIDQVFSLRVLAEKASEYNTPLYLCFVDLRKAYDSVSRDALWVVLQKRYRFLESYCGSSKPSIEIQEELCVPTIKCRRSFPSRMVCDREMCWPRHSEWCATGRCAGPDTQNGVRQGDVLAPTLRMVCDREMC